MNGSGLTEEGKLDFFGGMMIQKAKLILHPARSLVALVIAAPDSLYIKVVKCVAKKLASRFGDYPLTPKSFSRPIAKLIFIPIGGKIVSVKSYTADYFAAFFKADGIDLGSGKHPFNYFSAFLRAFMGRPACREAYLGIAGEAKQLLRIRFLAAA